MPMQCAGTVRVGAARPTCPLAMRRLFDGEQRQRQRGQRPGASHRAAQRPAAKVRIDRARRDAVAAARTRADGSHARSAAAKRRDRRGERGHRWLRPRATRLAVDALRDFHDGRLRVHFLSQCGRQPRPSICCTGWTRRAPPRILVSKSFGTQETLLNGAIAARLAGRQRAPVRRQRQPGKAHGGRSALRAERVLPMWDWVGGRYSLWSSVGFVLQLAIGREGFGQLLAGAALHGRACAGCAAGGQPARMARADGRLEPQCALGRTPAHAVVPYDERLALLPDFLQQLVMESLGKSVRTGRPRPCWTPTVPVVWGGAGSTVQHSFFQALHQGTDIVPVDFLGRRAAGARPCGKSPRPAGQPARAVRRPWPMAHRIARCAEGLSGQPAVEPAAAGRADARHSLGRAAGDVRAQRLRAVRAVGHQRLRPMGRRAGQAASPANCCRRCRTRVSRSATR